MKKERNILIAFILNFSFSIVEFVGGMLTGSVAIISDAVHDVADATSIGLAYFFERKSKKKADGKYTYGYVRYSALSGAITTLILIVGSILVIISAVERIINPTEIHYDGMIVLALVGVVINLSAYFFTKSGESLNHKAVNLHMVEDCLGWIVVLVGAVVMRFTDFSLLDSIMSIAVASFVGVSAIKNLSEIFSLFLIKMPKGHDKQRIERSILSVFGVKEVYHLHVWSIDEENICATLHIVSNEPAEKIKKAIRAQLKMMGINHSTIEVETSNEEKVECRLNQCHESHHHHHH